MPLTDYSNRTASLALAATLAGAQTTDAVLVAYLDDSAATGPVYRPFYAASRYLTRRRTVLLSGEGATFRDPGTSEAALLQDQARIDRALSLVVAAGFEAIVPGSLRRSSGSVPIEVVW